MPAIGLFDSGMGGLSVLKVLRHRFPREHFLYFADSAYRPYGEKTEDQIRDRSHSIIKWMMDQEVKMIVVPCHTSSSVLEPLTLPIPCITMLSPSIESVFSRSYTQGVGIIATPLSVSKGTLVAQLIQRGFSKPIHARACPELVPLIENQEWREATRCLDQHLTYLRNKAVDHILYGCTHYPFLDSFLDQNSQSQMIDPAQHVGHLIDNALKAGTLSRQVSEQGQLSLYHTGDAGTLPPHFDLLRWEWQEIKKIPTSLFEGYQV